MKNKSIAALVPLLCTFIAFNIYSQYRPYPQHITYPNCIKPNHVSQQAMDNAVAEYYTKWKRDHTKQAGSTTDGYYVYTGGGTGTSGDAVTISEAHGYGMILFALMGGKDAEAQNCFDGMYKVFRDHPSEANNDLMSWEIRGGDDFELDAQSATATDGDLDMAYALLLAHDQWGSDGAVDYMNEAKKMIAAIKNEEMGQQSKRVLMGSWDNNEWSTRSSDWMGGHLNAFYDVVGDNFWSQAASTIYDVFTVVRNSTTGLVPDFVVGQDPEPAPPNFLEGEHDGHYYNNACRVPLRIAIDYAHYETAEAKAVLIKMLDWLVSETNNDPKNIENGYTLEGVGINTSGDPWGSYLAPFISGCVVDEKYQEYLNDGWDMMKDYHYYSGYYSGTLQLLGLIFISGNWWKPGEPNIGTIYVGKSGKSDISFYTKYSPVSNTINVSFNIPHPAEVTLSCVNPQGKIVAEHVESFYSTEAKLNTIHFNTNSLSSGVYFVKLSINNKAITKQVSIIR